MAMVYAWNVQQTRIDVIVGGSQTFGPVIYFVFTFQIPSFAVKGHYWHHEWNFLL